MVRGLLFCFVLFLFIGGTTDCFAQAGQLQVSGGGISLSIDPQAAEEDYSAPVQILLLLTLLSVAPAALMLLTAFTRIVIVLSMLRQALAMPSTPPNSVLVSFALILTIYVMLPVFESINAQAIEPYMKKEVSAGEAITLARVPIQEFMINQTQEKNIALILELSEKSAPNFAADLEFSTLVPAFLLSELQSAFEIGFIIFLPFIMIDLIVASVLMSMGMIMLPPTSISLPIKILVFVLIEGWSLLAYSLIGSFK
ncbi:flagellar type III secretion system pore protein FliP [Microbulbifer rhizosphaerae]|uniref:Flagellar biosynthetic protein FliP n=1 Tax=Microbulbifer rhizosphaerae TaxID=1562603 RepID=A0A7W4WGT6_9GAMM|nr:flagellar biosynthetic protein FliP [Microbulbifer rhizosphaerae]